MDFDKWLDEAWNQHADEPAAVAARIASTGAGLARSEDQVEALMRLAHHVAGAHLGSADQLAEGRALLRQLAQHPGAGDAARANGQLLMRSLALTGADEDALGGLDAPGAIRVRALAASNLADRDALRAGRLLDTAVSDAHSAALANTDPAVRALAVAGNNIAAALAELPRRNEAERALMMQAAEVGLVFWRRAGTWLEEERAFHRLADCALAAGDNASARRHAQACLDIVAAQGGVALETFFGWEVMARTEAAAGDAAAHAQALSHMDAAFGRLEAADQVWCREVCAKARHVSPSGATAA